MNAREEMLDRVRKALARAPQAPLSSPLPVLDLAGVMPPLTLEGYWDKFKLEWEKVGGVAYRVTALEELEAVFQKAMVLAETHAVVISGNPLLAELGIAQRLSALNKLVTCWSAGPGILGTSSVADFTKASFAAGAGISGVDFVIAESGTLVVSSVTEGVQVASLAPPIHVALFRRSQLVGSLDEVLAQLPIANRPDRTTPGRSVVLITGTSRTADIEQILIRGVHGPREVHAVLVEDSCR